MPELTIDGKTIEVPDGSTILDAAGRAGIDIPTLCHYAGLGNIGACRVCIVEVEGLRRPVPSCTTPATDEMVVHTDTERLRALRKQTVELLFSERNHICPACTESGHCELQDLGYRFGMTHIRYAYLHPALAIDQSHPQIAMDHNRCVLCARCVRTCDERVGVHTLDIGGRGGDSRIVADRGIPLGESSCISCGACVQSCPTGALFEKRTGHWQHEREPARVKTICPACDAGCEIGVATLEDTLFNVAAGDGPANGGLVCRHGRFGLVAARPVRIEQPLLRRGGSLVPVAFAEAYEAIAARLNSGLLSTNRERAAGVVSTRLPVEVMAAFKQFMVEVIGTPHIATPLSTHTRAVRTAMDGEAVGGLATLADLDEADLYVTVGFDPDEVQGIAGMALRRGIYKRKAALVEINPASTAFSELAAVRITPRYRSDRLLLTGILKHLLDYASARSGIDEETAGTLQALDDSKMEAGTGCPPTLAKQAAARIATARKPLLLVGPGLTRQGAAATRAAVNLALLRGADLETGRLGLLFFLGGANAMPAAIMGIDTFDTAAFDPHATDLLIMAMGDENTPFSRATAELIGAVSFRLLIATHRTGLVEQADVVLPAPGWDERQGTFVNLESRVQTARQVRRKPGTIPDELQVLASLAAELGREGRIDSMSTLPGWIAQTADGGLLETGRRAEDLKIIIGHDEG